MIDKIREEIEQKINNLKDTDQKKYEILKLIIDKENWINDIPCDVFVTVLSSIGYKKEVALSYYKSICVEETKNAILKMDGNHENI